jgi:hypothetical protein
VDIICNDACVNLETSVDLPETNNGPEPLLTDQDAVLLSTTDLSNEDDGTNDDIACANNSATPKNDELQFLFPETVSTTTADNCLTSGSIPCDSKQCLHNGTQKMNKTNSFADKSSQTEKSNDDDEGELPRNFIDFFLFYVYSRGGRLGATKHLACTV